MIKAEDLSNYRIELTENKCIGVIADYFMESIAQPQIMKAYLNGDDRVLLKEFSRLPTGNTEGEIQYEMARSIYHRFDYDTVCHGLGKLIWDKILNAGYSIKVVDLPIDAICGYIVNGINDVMVKGRSSIDDMTIDEALKNGRCTKMQLCDVYIMLNIN